MAEITAEQKESASIMQNAVWNFRKKFYNPEARQEYWDNMINESEVLHKRFNSKYVDALILCSVDDFERRYRLEHKERYSFIPDDVLETVYRRIKINRKKEGVQ